MRLLFILCPVIMAVSALSTEENGVTKGRVPRMVPGQHHWARKPLPPRSNNIKSKHLSRFKTSTVTPPTGQHVSEPWARPSNNVSTNEKYHEINFTCPDEGFYPVADECNSYIDCRYLKAMKYYCKDGKHFDSSSIFTQQPCSDPEKVQCKRGGSQQKLPSIPFEIEPATIETFTYITVNPKPLENDTLPETSQNDNSSNVPTIGTPTGENRYNATNFTCEDGGFHPVPNECNSYIDCRYNRATKYYCEDGLYFDSTIQLAPRPCSKSGKLQCVPKGTSNETVPVSEHVDVPPTEHNDTSSSKPTEPPTRGKYYGHETNFTCISDGYHAVPNECDSYIHCIYNVSIKYYCKKGLHFNPATKRTGYPCTYPVVAQCSTEDPTMKDHQNPSNIGRKPSRELRPAHQETISVTKPTTPTYPPVKLSTKYPTIGKYNDPLEIDHNCKGDGYYAVSNKCDSYIECANNVAKRKWCRNGLLFNPATKYGKYPCSNPSEVKCRPKSFLPKDHLYPGRFPLPKPTSYAHYQPTTPTYPPVKLSTKQPSKGKYNDPLEIDYNCKGDGYHAVPNDCYSYIECTNNVAMKKLCRNGFYFNPAATYGKFPCSQPSEAKCRTGVFLPKDHQNQNKPSHEMVPAYQETISVINAVPERDQRNTSKLHSTSKPTTRVLYTPTTPTNPPVKLSAKRPTIGKYNDPLEIDYNCKGDGYHAIANDCYSYIECTNNVAKKKLCRNGRHFNPAAKYGKFPCSHPSEVKCRSRIFLSEDHQNQSQPSHEMVPAYQETISVINAVPESDQRNTSNEHSTSKPTTRVHYKPTTTTYPPVKSSTKQPSKGKYNEPLDIDYNCKCDGYHAVANDCYSYIECTNNVAKKKWCPNDLHFNPAAKYGKFPCSHPLDVECRSGIFIPKDHQNQSKPSHEMVLAYQETISVIDPVPERDHTSNGHSTPKPTTHVHHKPTTPTYPPGKWSTKNPTEGKYNDSLNIDYNCKGDGYHAVVNDCHSYIECTNNEAKKKWCRNGLLFNLAAKYGEFPCSSEVKCKSGTFLPKDDHHKDKPSPKPTPHENYKPTTPTYPPGKWSTKNPTEGKYNDSLNVDYNCKGDGYHAVVNDCHSYIECTNNEAKKKWCRNGLLFNLAAEYGEFPCSSEVKCKSGTFLPKDDHHKDKPSPKPTPHEHYKPTTPTYPLVKWSTPQPPIGKYNDPVAVDYDCKGDGYHAVPKECDSYIVCTNNVGTKNWCQDGLLFNPAAKYGDFPCSYPAEVTCRPGDFVQSPKSTKYCPQQYGFYVLDNTECSQYVNCQEGLGTVMDCPPGLVFNERKSVCDWPINVPECNPNVFKDFVCPTPPTGHGVFSDVIFKYRYDRDCSRYIACQEAHPRLLKCDDGTFFDSHTRSCIDSKLVTDCSVASPSEHLLK